MKYKAIFGCACLGWIIGWGVAPRIASEIWPPIKQVETYDTVTPKGRVIPGTMTRVFKSGGVSTVEQLRQLLEPSLELSPRSSGSESIGKTVGAFELFQTVPLPLPGSGVV